MSVFATEFSTFGGGRRAPVGALADGLLHAKIKRYKRNVAKRYRIIFPEKIREFLPDGRLFISTKIDGELWFLVKQAGEVALVAYNGRVIEGIEVVDEAAQHLEGRPDGLYAGELFAATRGGKGRPRVHDVGRALREDALAPMLGFKVFDVLEIDGEDWQTKPYDERWDELSRTFGAGRRCSAVLTVQGERDEAVRCYEQWVASQRFEGLVVRSEQGNTYKIKPALFIDAVVIAYGERQEGAVTVVRELNVALVRDDGSFHVLGPVGSGLDDASRLRWHERLAPLTVDSAYRMANRDGTLCRFVRPEIVIELRCSDLMGTDTTEAPNRRMALEYDEATGYAPLQELPLPSLIHPIFIRERPDKTVDAANVGLDQIYSYIPFDDREVEPHVVDLPTSRVIRRQVFVKETKGKVAVRKYVVVETNKHATDERFPPYVIHFTDFSAGRKEPLQTGLRVASTEARVDGIVEQWIADNVKRGWSEHGS